MLYVLAAGDGGGGCNGGEGGHGGDVGSHNIDSTQHYRGSLSEQVKCSVYEYTFQILFIASGRGGIGDGGGGGPGGSIGTGNVYTAQDFMGSIGESYIMGYNCKLLISLKRLGLVVLLPLVKVEPEAMLE